MTTPLEQTLLERACRYGSFEDVAQRTNNIYASILHDAPQLPSTQPHHREALHMIAMKIARLVNGQINDADSWQDIAGYATLVRNQIEAREAEKAAQDELDTHPSINELDKSIAAIFEEGRA